MGQHYSDPARENDPHALPDVETFYVNEQQAARDGYINFPGGEGWYWWTCLPGCLPDSDARGPFPSEDEAILDATDYGD